LRSARGEASAVLKSVLKRPVTWLSTTELLNRFEQKDDETFVNACEQRVILKLLGDMNREVKNPKVRIAVISGYSGQVNALRREFAKNSTRWPNLDIDCNTVDAFQGREADVAIYSVTRSNPDRKIGFLSEVRRLNVALSRGRDYLIIVGDHYFARSADGENPFRQVLEHIEANRSDCELRGAMA
jgi:superfamily I DNA and/or RNA helicase